MGLVVEWGRDSRHPPQIPYALSAVDLGVAVEQLLPSPPSRRPDGLEPSNHWGQVADHENRWGLRVDSPDPRHNAVLRVTAIDPGEASLAIVVDMECGLTAIQAIQVGDPMLNTTMTLCIEEFPRQFAVVVPLGGLPKLPSHKQ